MPYNETVSCNEKYLISSEADIRNPSDKRKPMVAIKATTGFFQLFFSRFPVFFLLFFSFIFFPLVSSALLPRNHETADAVGLDGISVPDEPVWQ